MAQTIKDDDHDDDHDRMAHMGYEQELQRGLDGFMSFAISFTEVSALVSVVSLFSYGLETGGPELMIFGWIITFFFTLIVAFNFAEICSVFPSAGSVYYWAGVLAPKQYGLISAYWAGTFNLLGT